MTGPGQPGAPGQVPAPPPEGRSWDGLFGRRRTRFSLVLTPLLLLACLWAAVAAWTVSERSSILESEREGLVQLNSAVAENVNGLFRLVEMALTAARDWAAAHPGVDPARDPEFIQLLGDLRNASNRLFDITLITRQGDVRLLTTAEQARSANVADREFFAAWREGRANGLYVSGPVKERLGGRWIIPVSMPLENAGGDVVLAVAMVGLDHLEAQHDEARPKPNGSVALVRDDGVMLSRTPFLETVLGQSIANSPVFARHVRGQTRGLLLTSGNLTDGVERLVSFNRLAGYPVIVSVSSGLDDALEGWVKNTIFRVVILLAGSAVVCAIVWKLDRALALYAAARRELELQASTDELTGLANRRSFLAQGAREVERALRYSRQLSLLMVDVDHFKAVNDRHGHAAGDRLLREFAEILRMFARNTDVCARVGGEEFAVLLVETGGREAQMVAERLCERIRQTRFAVQGATAGITASIGQASLGGASQSLESLYKAADQALYMAKRLGRDRVESA